MHTARPLFSRTGTTLTLASLLAVGGLMIAGVTDMTRRFDPTPPTIMVQLEPVVITGHHVKAQAAAPQAAQPALARLAVSGLPTVH
jgi:hypothetical protein